MRNKIRYIRLIGLIFVLIVGSSLTFAQNKSKRKSAKKPLVEVVSFRFITGINYYFPAILCVLHVGTK